MIPGGIEDGERYAHIAHAAGGGDPPISAMKRTIYSPRKHRESPSLGYRNEAQSQGGLQQIIRHLPVAACLIDRESRVYLEANDRFVELVGVPRERIIGQREEEIPAGLGIANLDKIITYLKQGNVCADYNLLLFNQKGRLIKTQTNASAVQVNGRAALLVSLTPLPRETFLPRSSEQDTRLAAAGEIGQALLELIKPPEIYSRLASSIYQLHPSVSTVYISLFDPRRKRLFCVHLEHEHTALDASLVPDIHLADAQKNLQAEVMLSGQAQVVDDLQAIYPLAHRNPLYKTPGKPPRSVVYLPMISKGVKIGLVQIHSPLPGRFNQTDTALFGLVTNTAAIALHNAQLAQDLEHTSLDLAQTYEATIEGWTRALELRDFTTERHTQRVVTITIELSKKLGLDGRDLLRVRRGAQLHDIGKMGIPDQILLKPGPLDDSEWRIMRRHPVYAYELLRPIPHFNEILEIPYCHHEKWDGSGYPRRLRGEEIPLSARIFSVVDVWDALSSNRPYRAAWPANQVIDYIDYQSNKQFEPEVTRAFLDLVRSGTVKGAHGLRPAGGNVILR